MKKIFRLTKGDVKKFVEYRHLEIKYSVFILLFIVCIFAITITVLTINYNMVGPSHIIKDYYDIRLFNASMDYETDTEVILKQNQIIINVDDIYIYKKTNSINIQVENIGNIDSELTYLNLIKKYSTIDSSKVDVKMSLEKGDIISGGETKMLKIDITCNDKNAMDYDSVRIEINFQFGEVEK